MDFGSMSKLKIICVVTLAIMVIGVIGSRYGGQTHPLTQQVTKGSSAQQDSSSKESDQLTRAVLGVQSLRAVMRDPESFRLESVLLMDNGAICYEYRARNGFGGYNREHAVLRPKASALDTSAGAWNRNCANKSGTDYTSQVNSVSSLLRQ